MGNSCSWLNYRRKKRLRQQELDFRQKMDQRLIEKSDELLPFYNSKKNLNNKILVNPNFNKVKNKKKNNTDEDKNCTPLRLNSDGIFVKVDDKFLDFNYLQFENEKNFNNSYCISDQENFINNLNEIEKMNDLNLNLNSNLPSLMTMQNCKNILDLAADRIFSELQYIDNKFTNQNSEKNLCYLPLDGFINFKENLITDQNSNFLYTNNYQTNGFQNLYDCYKPSRFYFENLEKSGFISQNCSSLTPAINNEVNYLSMEDNLEDKFYNYLSQNSLKKNEFNLKCFEGENKITREQIIESQLINSQLETEPWFFSNIKRRAVAEHVLRMKGNKIGAFLIRFSQKNKTINETFVLSLKVADVLVENNQNRMKKFKDILHYKIYSTTICLECNLIMYYINPKTKFITIRELVLYYSNCDQDGLLVKLDKPCLPFDFLNCCESNYFFSSQSKIYWDKPRTSCRICNELIFRSKTNRWSTGNLSCIDI